MWGERYVEVKRPTKKTISRSKYSETTTARNRKKTTHKKAQDKTVINNKTHCR